MNLYINIPYKTGEHKNETKNTKFICLYIKISFSPFFPPSLSTRALLGLQGPRESRGVSRKSAHIYSKHKHAKSEDKPLQIQL